MKIVIVLSVLLAIVAAKHLTREETVKIRDDCEKENNLNEEQIKNINSFQFPDEEPIHKTVRCISKGVGVWDDVTGFNIDEISGIWGGEHDKENVVAEANKCLDKNEKGTSLDEWAYRNFVCMANSPVLKEIRERRNKPSN